VTVNTTDGAPPEESAGPRTSTRTSPARSRKAFGTSAEIVVVSEKVVARGAPFQKTRSPGVNPQPVTRIAESPPSWTWNPVPARVRDGYNAKTRRGRTVPDRDSAAASIRIGGGASTQRRHEADEKTTRSIARRFIERER